MNYYDRRKYACYDTRYLSLAFSTKDASMAYLGLDSGGRKIEAKNTYNLLKPSLGAIVLPTARAMRGATVSHGPDGISAKGPAGSFAFAPCAGDDRSFDLRFSAPRGAALKGTVYRANLQIRTAPPTVWADTEPAGTDDPNAGNRKPRKVPGVQASRLWQLPMTIHFPDYGHLRIESTSPAIECFEELVESKEMSGLNLGYMNHGLHTFMVNLHHGVSRLSFRVKRGAAPKSATLRFTVLPEIAPSAPFVADPAWNGFRRSWLNNFALNRETLSMGDNIFLNGMAHLAVHNKADMLELCDPKDNPLFARIRHHFTTTLDTAFSHCQAADGEISWEYWNTPKKDGKICGAFIDTTPSNLISGCIAYGWDPKAFRHWIPALLRAADFLMKMDPDGDGLIELPFGGENFGAPWNHPGGRPRIWWDNIAFGHKDAWFNLLSHRGIRLLAPIARANGFTEEADRLDAWLKAFPAVFRRELYNPESGIIAGWRDIKGRLHDYRFTFPTAMAIEEGVLPKAQGRAMLKKILGYLQEAGFGDCRYGIPGNTLPIALGEDTFDWAFMAAWPRYENGGCCGMTAWHFINALYAAGLEKEADDLYFRILDTFEKEPTHSGLFPGYMESCDWRTKDGNLCGYNYLADNYAFLASGFIHHTGKSHPIFAK